MKKTALIVVAQTSYQPIEYADTKRILEDHGITVYTVSTSLGTATAADDSTTSVDYTIAQITTDMYDGIYLIGGPGSLEGLDNEQVHHLLQGALANGKSYGGICVATRILAHAGVLGNRKATGWNPDHALEKLYPLHGATYIDEPVVRDHEVVTAVGPQAAETFAQEIARVLKEQNDR